MRFNSALCRAMSRARTRLVLFFDRAFYYEFCQKVPAFGGCAQYPLDIKRIQTCQLILQLLI